MVLFLLWFYGDRPFAEIRREFCPFFLKQQCNSGKTLLQEHKFLKLSFV